MLRLNTGKIKKITAKILTATARHFFLSCFLLFFLSLIIGGFLIYKYSIAVKRAELGDYQYSGIREEIFLDILKHWHQRQEKSERADLTEYLNPFVWQKLGKEELTE